MKMCWRCAVTVSRIHFFFFYYLIQGMHLLAFSYSHFFSRWGTYFSSIFVFQLMFSWCGTGDYCVMKKVKCSGELPCRVCKRKQLDCVFSPKQRPGPKIRMNTACVESSRNGYEKATNIKVPFVEIKSPRCEQPKLLEADSGEDSTYHLTNALLSLKYRACLNSTIPE